MKLFYGYRDLSILQGIFCERRCKNGYFGDQCASKCLCLNGNECDPITGQCLCIGFTGEHCEKPCPKGTYGVQVIFYNCFSSL